MTERKIAITPFHHKNLNLGRTLLHKYSEGRRDLALVILPQKELLMKTCSELLFSYKENPESRLAEPLHLHHTNMGPSSSVCGHNANHWTEWASEIFWEIFENTAQILLIYEYFVYERLLLRSYFLFNFFDRFKRT